MDKVILIDEALTPDSSRFWPKETTSRAGASRHSTSSTCAIIWKRSIGTNSLPGPSCLRRW